MSKVGRKFELSLYNDIEKHTSDDVHAAVSDYSGGAASSFCDLEVYYPTDDGDTYPIRGAFIEVKKRQAQGGYRKTVVEGSEDGERGRDELERLVNNCPPWGQPFLALKWNNREMIVERADDLLTMLVDDEQPPWDGRLTGMDNISMRKPALDEHPSQTSGRPPWHTLVETIGVPSTYIQQ